MNKILVLKVTGFICSVGGMLLTTVANEMDTKVQLAKLVSQSTK